MRIEVFSDSVCPWCYIGKRHLESALQQAQMADAEVRWRAFQLNPDLPPEGRDRREYLDAKFGGPEAVQAIHMRIEAAGRGTGIDFQFDKIGRSPNTLNSHRLIRLAESQQRASAMVETLFRAYFIEGRDIGDAATLAELAHTAGVTGDIRAWLEGGGERTAVLDDLHAARTLGINGVPFFIIENRYTLSGAQPVAVFMQALQAAHQKIQSVN
jgi:predicted DsbA family dithiol-disulfide isomerase